MEIGPFTPASVVSSGSGVAWVNPSNAKTDNNLNSYVNLGGNQTTQLLQATDFRDAGGSLPAVPSGATNVVARFDVEKKRQVGIQCQDAAARLVTAGTPGATDYSKPGLWPVGPLSGSGTVVSYSIPATPVIADSGSGFALSGKEVADDSQGAVQVDAIRLTISFEVP